MGTGPSSGPGTSASFDYLIYLAAQSALLFSDDTTMKVAALRQEIQKQAKPDRTGIFTSGIVGQAQEHPIALFLTGRAHAGENLAKCSPSGGAKTTPLHMCDGWPTILPKGIRPWAANATFTPAQFCGNPGDFPEECRKVVTSYAEIYRTEDQIKAAGLSDQARLERHQAKSQPVMEELKAWFTNWWRVEKSSPTPPWVKPSTICRFAGRN